MSLITEAGMFGPLICLTFVVGMVAVVRSRAREATLSVSSSFALLLLALGQLGQGLGQRMVDAYLEKIPDTAQKVVLLSAGTREASASLILGGAAAALLVLLAASLRVADRDHR